MKWQEMPQRRLKALCDEQAVEDIDVFQYCARVTGTK